MITNIDNRFMRMAIRLARQSIRNRSFERFVGAVAVVDGHAVGHGFADANQGQGAALKAIEETGSRAGEATLYSNIEPCLDSPDFDACFKRLIRFHPRRIVIGAVSDSETGAPDRDPAGKEVAEQLRRAAIEAGIEVDTGVCANECVELNEVYSKFRQTGLPFVTVKAASTLDGRIATATGDSQWISGERSLRLAHELRRDHDAVLVGIGTVLKDDPKLTVRLVKGADPLRVVVDSKLRIPHTASLLADGAARKTTIATTNQSDPAKAERLREIGAEVLVLPSVHCLASPANNGES
ncbi:MAG TPA: bifunctional diaminohydroxyphosphoribosylaminopyrimidine deaminase/5-amino-6-(5-phosphoribosylamino)uracil reductase RibD, partial [Blastocatellia bacterium]|nr:bifunctional diaminohydroxyphosphoribosylaminopyrimidine deaminase/5-amino-6-(5-phosphoribosylamino)uracil reductase RibD [Blastocatellia bacterium]